MLIPCPCKIANQWILKNSSDQENVQWILAKTKQCPKCKVAIEKNQGCNHMSCTKCNHQFCWLCKQEWATHGSATGGFYKCNIYEQQKDSGYIYDEEKKQHDAQFQLDRYSFYLTRFDNHLNSGKVALKEMKHKQQINSQNRSNNMNNMDYSNINAYKLIIQCRNVLAWTYPIAYFLPTNYKKLALFTEQQTSLESYTEHLHELLEKKENNKNKNKNKNKNDQSYNDYIGELNNYIRCLQKYKANMMTAIR